MTCDWGYCDDLATGWRWAPDLKLWLPVCSRHGIYICRDKP